jgi:hypothetical protein
MCHRDALNRHLTRCKSAHAGARVRSSHLNRACVACSERKIKCSGETTCQRCAAMQLACTYAYHGSTGEPQGVSPSSPRESMEPEPHNLMSPQSSEGGYQERDLSVAVDTVATQQFSPAATSNHEGTTNPDDSQCSDTMDVMPWLSWDWTEQMSANPADVTVSLWSMPDRASDQLLSIGDSWSVGGDGVAPDGPVDDCYASLQASTTSIVNSKLDPVEHHRNKIIEHLQNQPHMARKHRKHWLERDNFQVLLKTYFNRHHRHTPIIHLSTFNIVSCPTSLVFAIALIAASYMPRLGLRTADTLALAETAYALALYSDEVGTCQRITRLWIIC